MKKKLLDLLENHVDKLILGVIAIASIAVLWFFVIGSPYSAKVGFAKYSPGKIDAKIREKSAVIEQRIIGDATVEFRKYSGNKATKMETLLGGSLNIKDNVVMQMASIKKGTTDDNRFYRKPAIGIVEAVDAELIRTAVFVPTENVDMTLTYQQAETEVDDIDFVTVQGSFDVAGLYRNFKKSFVDSASAEDKDEKIALPVFAAVCLERQTLDASGQWSDWQRVKRPNIDHRREMFVLPEKAKDVELGGVDLLRVNFEDFEVQKDLLQPAAYDIAASNAEWMTPTYHKEMEEILAKEIKDKAMEATGRVKPGRRAAADTMGMGVDMDVYGVTAGAGRGPGGRTASRGGRAGREQATRGRRPNPSLTRRDRTVEDIREDFEFLMLTEDVDLEIMKEPFVFWAYDNDLKPLGTYRYRMRVGVFNPAAGKDWFKGPDAEFKDDVVLWSDYSEVTDEIAIDPMVHFFPIEVARGEKEATIQVSKFHDGKWQSEEFAVRVGESIGAEIEVEVENEMGGKRPARRRTAEDIKMIDFSSGAILVDIVESRRSTSGGRPYQEILYSEDGSDIKHVGVSKRNWSKALAAVHKDIADDEDIRVDIAASRGQSGRRAYHGGGRDGGYGDMGDMGDTYDMYGGDYGRDF